MVNHHPSKFGHGHCGNGDIFSVAVEQYFTCSCLNRSLLFLSKELSRFESTQNIMLISPILATYS